MHPDDARSEVWESTAAIQQLVDLGYVDPLSDDAQENLKLVRLHQDFNLARVHLNVHQPGAALPIMERVAQAWPHELAFQLHLAQCYYQTGRMDDCRRVVAAVLLKDADRPMAHLLEANLCLAEGRISEGLDRLLAAEHSARPAPGIRCAIGQVYLTLQRWEDAKRAFGRALEVDPESAPAYSGLARALLEWGDSQAAAEAATDAVALRFDLPEAHYTLAIALARMGRFDRAVQAMANCVAQQPNSVAARQSLAGLRKLAAHTEAIDECRDLAPSQA